MERRNFFAELKRRNVYTVSPAFLSIAAFSPLKTIDAPFFERNTVSKPHRRKRSDIMCNWGKSITRQHRIKKFGVGPDSLWFLETRYLSPKVS
jgi:hypothetical protein